jgi:short-subunit dehydrogenase
LAFAKRKSRLVLAARRTDKLRELARLVHEHGTQSVEVACDVREPKEAKQAVDAAISRWRSIDVLINNAGILEIKSFQDQSLEMIEDIIKTNLLGCIYTLHEALPHMQNQGSGHIVNVSSIAGLMGLPQMAAYCASKFALIGLTESLRREFYGTGITLTAFCPGVVDTPMAAPVRERPLKPKTAEQAAEKIVRATEHRAPEIIYGEAPGSIIKLARLFPGLMDQIVHSTFKRFAADRLSS